MQTAQDPAGKLSLEQLAGLNAQYEKLSPAQILKAIEQELPDPKYLSLSTQVEGIVLLDLMLKQGLKVTAYSIDTGRMHEESYLMLDKIRFKYNISIEMFLPDAKAVQELVSQKGMYSFKETLTNRHECCGIRKIEPNRRALENARVWVTGLRRDQSEDRATTQIVEYRGDLDVYKVSPLANWSGDEVIKYAKENKVPFHPLYNQGYTSIGCQPCTRPIAEGEDERAGRWWWEQGVKECGLHLPTT